MREGEESQIDLEAWPRNNNINRSKSSSQSVSFGSWFPQSGGLSVEHSQRVLQLLLHQNKTPSNKRNSQRQKENNRIQTIQSNLLLFTQPSFYKMLRETCWKLSPCWTKRPCLEGEWKDTERQGRADWCWCWSGWMDGSNVDMHQRLRLLQKCCIHFIDTILYLYNSSRRQVIQGRRENLCDFSLEDPVQDSLQSRWFSGQYSSLSTTSHSSSSFT